MSGEADWVHVVFRSSGGAAAAQRALDGVCPAIVMPVLRQVSAACGVALRLVPGDLDRARDALGKAGIPAEFYAVTGTGTTLACRKL